MGQSAKPTRQNRTITVDFHDETTYSELLAGVYGVRGAKRVETLLSQGF